MDNFKRLWMSAAGGFVVGMLLAFFTSINPVVVLVAIIFSAAVIYFATGIKKNDGGFNNPGF